jgi:hypothetical protein
MALADLVRTSWDSLPGLSALCQQLLVIQLGLMRVVGLMPEIAARLYASEVPVVGFLQTTNNLPTQRTGESILC